MRRREGGRPWEGGSLTAETASFLPRLQPELRPPPRPAGPVGESGNGQESLRVVNFWIVGFFHMEEKMALRTNGFQDIGELSIV